MDINTQSGEQFSRTILGKSPSLRKDFINEVYVKIQGIYGIGVGYLSNELHEEFLTLVHEFCLGNGLQYTPESVYGQLSDNQDSYIYFMGMECAFRSTSNVSALELAEKFSAVLSEKGHVNNILVIK